MSPRIDIDVVIVPPTRDLGGGFTVRRALPSSRRQMVGPFIFFDEMGRTELPPGTGLDVRPHPHIGLATVTYLFEGEILHRDSLGNVCTIRPGAVNWMVAGRGIAHSERTPQELRQEHKVLFGIQAWVALPKHAEENEPEFSHFDVKQLPALRAEGVDGRVIAGTLHGARSPVATESELFYADISIAPRSRMSVPAEYEERAAYIVEGSLEVQPGSHLFGAGQLIVFRPHAPVILGATKDRPVRFMLLGGAPTEEPRHIWWNFVSSSKERIEQAKSDWNNGRFPAIPGETEFIPLPGSRPATVNYP